MKNSLLIIFLLGLIIRLIIAGTTFHPDVKIINFTSAVFTKEFYLNPYDFKSQIIKSQKQVIYKSETPDDLPLQYLVILPVQFLERPFINDNIENQFLVDHSQLLGNFSLFLHLMLIKFPVIVFDLALGLLLTYFVSQNAKRTILTLWMFNPFSIWVTAAIGQVDVIPTFFLMLSLFLIQQNKLKFAALSLGFGAAIKSFPFLLAPFLILLGENLKQRISITLLILIPYILSILPYLPSQDFRTNALFSPQLDKILYAKLPISGGESIIITIAILLCLYFLFNLNKDKSKNLVKYIVTTLLLILSFTHFHIQWFLWVTPLLLLLVLQSKKFLLPVSLLYITVFGMMFLFEASLQTQLFAPLFPMLNNTKGLTEILLVDYVNLLKNILATLFFSTSIILIYFVFSKD